MTQDEAQELIAEIDNLHKEICDFHCDGCRPDYAQIRRIITRFANKPPECGYEIHNEDNSLIKICDAPGDYFPMPTRVAIKSPSGCWMHIDLTINKLTELRDNIDKMLEWLDGQDN